MGSGITNDCDPPCECRELNPGAVEEQPILLTTKSSLQPQDGSFKYVWKGVSEKMMYGKRWGIERGKGTQQNSGGISVDTAT